MTEPEMVVFIPSKEEKKQIEADSHEIIGILKKRTPMQIAMTLQTLIEVFTNVCGIQKIEISRRKAKK